MAKPFRDAGPDRPIRCAIYTRKSTEEGLEQEFNSLDAQYEACAAYIVSQRHEGWALVDNRYDDGGFSGGNLERPGLKRLLADIAAGKVDVIVIYKVDRLTRSLSDFSKIVDVLDEADASFVSVTQAFNTTTSMGRLMLNVLLSFAQFEREVTGERIRDKIAASKRKGMWMGGNPPLGYEVRERKLVVNEADAEIVRHIFRRYAALGSGRALITELREQGYRTKVRFAADKQKGGIPFERGMLFHILGNRVYIGETVHQGVAYPGEHIAIIEPALWDAVQQRIAGNSVERRAGGNAREPSLLAGIIRDGHGRRMTPSHAVKAGKRYRYYITHNSELTTGSPPAWRIPSGDIEEIVVERLRALLLDQSAIATRLGAIALHAERLQIALALAADAAGKLQTAYGKRSLVGRLVAGAISRDGGVEIAIDGAGLARLLGHDDGGVGELTLTAPAARVRRGKDVKLVSTATDGSASAIDDKLIALLREAAAAREAVEGGAGSLEQIAAEQRQCRHRLAQLVRLSYLSPTIVRSIVEGEHDAALTPRGLLTAAVPECWDEQHRLLAGAGLLPFTLAG